MSYLSGYVHYSHVIAAWQTSDFDQKLDDNNIIILWSAQMKVWRTFVTVLLKVLRYTSL